MNLAVHQIEREWRYRQGIVFCLVMTLLFGCLAPLCLYFAVTDQGDANFHGIRIPAVAAIPLRWLAAALLCSMLVMAVVMLWQRVVHPEKRIAITPDGILMPRHRWTNTEEFLRFDQIERVDFSRYRGHVTMFNLYGPSSTFSVARQMLTQSEFDEIVELIRARWEQSAGGRR